MYTKRSNKNRESILTKQITARNINTKAQKPAQYCYIVLHCHVCKSIVAMSINRLLLYLKDKFIALFTSTNTLWVREMSLEFECVIPCLKTWLFEGEGQQVIGDLFLICGRTSHIKYTCRVIEFEMGHATGWKGFKAQ